jgi:regulator of protease activity HflC (stomatin/prohibitin superfamily)
VDRVRRVNVQVVTMPVPAQDGITRDNVTVGVDAWPWSWAFAARGNASSDWAPAWLPGLTSWRRRS